MSQIAPYKSSTLLEYVLGPTPDPPRASHPLGAPSTLVLTFIVNVPANLPQVYCESISFHFDVPKSVPTDDSSYLTFTASGVKADAQGSPDWTLVPPAGDGTFTFVRLTGVDPKMVGQSYTFEVYDIDTSPLVGSGDVTVTESSSTSSAAACTQRSATFNVPRFPPGFRSPQFQTATPDVTSSGKAILTWSPDPNGTYHIAWDDETPVDVTKQTSWPTPKLLETTTFELIVAFQAQGTTVSRSYYLTISVLGPVVVLKGDRDVIREGESVTLTWQTSGVTDCRVEADGGGSSQPIAGLPDLVESPTRSTTYRLSCTTTGGETVQSPEFHVEVIPRMPAVQADLVFIKTRNTPGSVELHYDAGAEGYQVRSGDWASNLPLPFAGMGTWQAIRPPAGPIELVFIQTAGTPGPVEVHVESFLGVTRLDTMLASTFTMADGPNGTWQIADMAQAGTFRDLVFLKTRNTAGNVEVHYDKLSAKKSERGGNWSSLYPLSKAPMGTWLMAHLTSTSGKPDLALVQTANTPSGFVELSCATGATNYSKSGGHWISAFDMDAAAGTWCLADMDGDGELDLVRIKTANTISGQIEVYYASAASKYQTILGGASEFNLADGANGVWQVLAAAP